MTLRGQAQRKTRNQQIVFSETRVPLRGSVPLSTRQVSFLQTWSTQNRHTANSSASDTVCPLSFACSQPEQDGQTLPDCTHQAVFAHRVCREETLGGLRVS